MSIQEIKPYITEYNDSLIIPYTKTQKQKIIKKIIQYKLNTDFWINNNDTPNKKCDTLYALTELFKIQVRTLRLIGDELKEQLMRWLEDIKDAVDNGIINEGDYIHQSKIIKSKYDCEESLRKCGCICNIHTEIKIDTENKKYIRFILLPCNA